MHRKGCWKSHRCLPFTSDFLDPPRLHAPKRALEIASVPLLASIAANQHQSRVSKVVCFEAPSYDNGNGLLTSTYDSVMLTRLNLDDSDDH